MSGGFDYPIGGCRVCTGQITVSRYVRVVSTQPHPDSPVPCEETFRFCSAVCLHEWAAAQSRARNENKHSFIHDGSRYPLDWIAGYAQLDTTQDASYYGHWANPEKLKLISYVEGDLNIITCRDRYEFCAQVRRVARIPGWKGLDPGFNESLRSRFVELGLGDLLYANDAAATVEAS